MVALVVVVLDAGMKSDVCMTTPTISCNVSDTLFLMWQNTWESDSRRPRHLPQSPCAVCADT